MKAFPSRFGLAALACVLGLASFAGQAADRWNMTVEQPDGNHITEVARDFARNVESATAGDLQIRLHSNSILFKRPEVKRAVQTGQVQLGDVLMSVLGNEDPIFEVDSVPFLARSFPQARKLWEVSRPAIEARLQKQGIRLLYATPWPPQSIFTQKPIASMADFKGMKFRAYNPATARMAELMGAVPTTINTGEVPQAFSAGMISGMLTSPATGVDTQAWDFSTYYYDVRAFIPKNFVIVNARAFAKLPQASQQAVLDAAAKAEAQGWALAEARTSELVKTLADKGMKVSSEAPGDLDAGFGKIGQTMVDEWLDKAGPDGKAIVDAFRKP
ncbi:TRAP transporter substrate-binding protein [Pseudomonas kuykendallii]|uniref:C4-dicarboxylate ABC transporter substrate-binding protein n=1 Tax=Pseudomonas kuykendallii TaxID=1007099 RepID=A0A2W5EZP8_9PSED|nr:TRAP transporter substrate-binding protein [Pseudomonas kuykendallii]PZP25616.1 MAG: C4-dicarboxylate ABC transporter substrate-binding protein [Pseudomonas kuykendallii]